MRTLFSLSLILVGVAIGWYGNSLSDRLQQRQVSAISTFEECADAGFPVMESYPRQCRTPDGKNFVEEILVGIPDLIVIDAPKAGETVTSPIRISGRARGNWYFEASFPVTLQVSDGTVLVQAPVQAQGEWMT